MEKSQLNAHQRKKQPELVRQRILNGAMQLAAERGVAGVSIQSVARLAGVTKGGVFHHFANKQILIEMMLHEALRKFDEEIDRYIEKDSISYGCFTRAYIEVTLTHEAFGVHSLWATLSMTFISDQAFCQLWNQWLSSRLSRHYETDHDLNLRILRYAVDGVWFIERFNSGPHQDLAELKQELIQRSYPNKNS